MVFNTIEFGHDTSELGGISDLTILPAAITDPAPIFAPGNIRQLRPIQTLSSMMISSSSSLISLSYMTDNCDFFA